MFQMFYCNEDWILAKIMKKLILTSIFLSNIIIVNADARMSSVYQRPLSIDEAISKIQPITNDAITLDPDIDEVKTSDPRIKSVMDYAKHNGSGVSIVFFNTNNLRYVKQVKQMFKENNIFTDKPQLGKTNNLLDFNLIKIYVIEGKHNDTKPKLSTATS